MAVGMSSVAVFALATSFFSFDANAMSISGVHTTAGGKNVELSNLEWLTWDQTVGISRNDIEAGNGNTFIADGWRYASRSEFEDLFDSLWGGVTDGADALNYDGTQWLYDNLDRTSGVEQNAYFGADGECEPSPQRTCGGYYANELYQQGRGFLHDFYGVSFGASPAVNGNYAYDKSIQRIDWSSALVRSDVSAVPIPAALPLFGTGLALMGFLSWRRKRQTLRI